MPVLLRRRLLACINLRVLITIEGVQISQFLLSSHDIFLFLNESLKVSLLNLEPLVCIGGRRRKIDSRTNWRSISAARVKIRVAAVVWRILETLKVPLHHLVVVIIP